MNINISKKLTKSILGSFTRKELRFFAKQWGIKVGKDKKDTVRSCTKAVLTGKARLCAEIMVKPNHPCGNEVAQSFAVKKVYSYKPTRYVKHIDGHRPAYTYNRV